MKSVKKFQNLTGHIWLPVIVAAGLKCALLVTGRIPFNSDEAIVALMARHINQGNLPIFFYGQAYMGSMDAILVALGFRVFGQYIWVIRAVQSILFLGTVATTALLGFRLSRSKSIALISGLLIAVPPVNISLYTTVSIGGYGEMFLIGNLLLLSGFWIINRVKNEGFKPDRSFFIGLIAWGLGAGFGFWVIGLTLVYTIPVAFVLFWEIIKTANLKLVLKSVALIVAGAIIGSIPWWTYAIGEGSVALISELTGGAIANINSSSDLIQPLERIGSMILFGGTVILGLRPPWDIRWLMMPILPFVLIFWLAVLYFSIKKIAKDKIQSETLIVSLMGAILFVGFIFTPYGSDPSGRYFTPLMVPMALFGADFLVSQFSEKLFLQIGILFLVLSFNLGGTIQSILEYPPGITTQFDAITQIDHRNMDELIGFLEKEEIYRGYSNYWVSYPLSFLSREEIIFVPRLPYHEDFRYTARDDRYAPYSDLVLTAEKVAYITTNHETLNSYLRQQFKDRSITWREKGIGDFLVFYDLSKTIHPQDIGLGLTTTP